MTVSGDVCVGTAGRTKRTTVTDGLDEKKVLDCNLCEKEGTSEWKSWGKTSQYSKCPGVKNSCGIDDPEVSEKSVVLRHHNPPVSLALKEARTRT